MLFRTDEGSPLQIQQDQDTKTILKESITDHKSKPQYTLTHKNNASFIL